MTAPHQSFEPARGLTDYHRRCLDKRIDECSEALAQAVRALCEAQAWEPRDVSLHALWGLLQAARGLTVLAHEMCGERAPHGHDSIGEHAMSKVPGSGSQKRGACG